MLLTCKNFVFPDFTAQCQCSRTCYFAYFLEYVLSFLDDHMDSNFSTQSHCCLTLPRQVKFCIFVFISMSRSIYILFM